jgi:hypothetical protein
MTSDIVSKQNRIVVMRYNTKWRNIRKVIHQVRPPEARIDEEFDDEES